MTLDEETRLSQLKRKCLNAVDEFGASPALRKFCLEIVEYEDETSRATFRMHEKLRQLGAGSFENLESLKQLVESMSNDFSRWNRVVDNLVSTGKSLPPLQATRFQGRELKAPSSLQTKLLEIQIGDPVTVTDVSQENVIKVRTQDGKEDYVPILIWILPCSDKTISSLLQRVLAQLLSAWTDCLGEAGKILLRVTKSAFQSLNLSGRELVEIEQNGSSIISRLKKFYEILKGSEVELVQGKTGKVRAQNQAIIGNLSKAFAAYQQFFEHWNNFRLQLKGRKPQPICIFEKFEDFKNHVSDEKQLKFFTTTFVVESTEIREETIHVPMNELDDDTSSYGGGGYWKQLIETEQLTSISQEEKKRYIIKAVKDPRTQEDISLKEAVEIGVIDMKNGLYVNPDTQESRPIPLALSEGKIQVDYVTKTRSVPKTEALGLITVRDRVESRNYTIVSVVDATTAEKVDLNEAKKRGLVDDDTTYFVVSTSGERIAMQDAIDSGWVVVEYDSEESPEEPEFQTRTYAVRAVVDQRLKKRVPFLEAVQKRLIDRESGNYYNNISGETIHALEAIRRGFLKAKLIDDPSKLDIDPTNKMVVRSINKMKCLVTGLSALSAMKESAKSTGSTGSV